MTINIRYIVDDVDKAIQFYRDQFGFRVDMHPTPGFAALSRDGVKLYLNRPGAGSAGQPDDKGAAPQPGGWNRFQIECDDLDTMVHGCDLRAPRSALRWLMGREGGRRSLRIRPAISSNCSNRSESSIIVGPLLNADFGSVRQLTSLRAYPPLPLTTATGSPQMRSRQLSGPVAQWLEPAAHKGLVPASCPGGAHFTWRFARATSNGLDHRRRSKRRTRLVISAANAPTQTACSACAP